MVNDRGHAMLRQLYILPECPTVEEVWQKWRDMGESATPREVRLSVWALPVELLTYRRIDHHSVPASIKNRLVHLYNLEERLIAVWQCMTSSDCRMQLIEERMEALLITVQRKLADVVREAIGGAV